jgi:hypothetical protein
MELNVVHKVERDVARAVKRANDTLGSATDVIEQSKRIYGTSLVIRGVSWIAIYALSRWLLESVNGQALRVAIALLPTAVFAWFLWTWVTGVARMDELERRIELEALAFAFPISIIFFATLGLLDVALPLSQDGLSVRTVWLMMPMLYYIGLWRAQRRYR